MRKGRIWIALGLAGLLITGVSFYLDKVLRASIERNINQNLRGYSEITIHEGNIKGYVKPIFKDVEVFDPRQDSDKGILQQAKEKLISGIARILRNRPRHEIATSVSISGTLDSPQYSTWEAVGGLLKNAFFKPLLPGLEKGAGTKPR